MSTWAVRQYLYDHFKRSVNIVMRDILCHHIFIFEKYRFREKVPLFGACCFWKLVKIEKSEKLKAMSQYWQNKTTMVIKFINWSFLWYNNDIRRKNNTLGIKYFNKGWLRKIASTEIKEGRKNANQVRWRIKCMIYSMIYEYMVKTIIHRHHTDYSLTILKHLGSFLVLFKNKTSLLPFF